MGEENFHMWYFAKACLDYAGKIYPAIQLQGPEQADSPELEDLYMFASTLIFEEFVDYYTIRSALPKASPTSSSRSTTSTTSTNRGTSRSAARWSPGCTGWRWNAAPTLKPRAPTSTAW